MPTRESVPWRTGFAIYHHDGRLEWIEYVPEPWRDEPRDGSTTERGEEGNAAA